MDFWSIRLSQLFLARLIAKDGLRWAWFETCMFCRCVPNIVLNGFNRAYSGRRHGASLSQLQHSTDIGRSSYQAISSFFHLLVEERSSGTAVTSLPLLPTASQLQRNQ